MLHEKIGMSEQIWGGWIYPILDQGQIIFFPGLFLLMFSMVQLGTIIALTNHQLRLKIIETFLQRGRGGI